MKILIADKFEESGVNELRETGCDVVADLALNGDSLRDAIVDSQCAILIVRSTRVTAAMIEASKDLSLIIRAGAGYNTIDVAAASKRGIPVANCPGKNSVAVAELTIGLILALDRRIVENVNDLRAGRWNKKEYGRARGLKGRTLGLIGTGQIGRAVIRRAVAMEMNVVAYGRSLTDDVAADLGVGRGSSPAAVAEKCDILSIHVAATPETKGLISRDILSRLAPGSYVINTARADVLDYEALADAIRERNLRVGLDVYPDEPSIGEGEFLDAILNADGIVYGTHHIGASTEQAQQAIADEAVRIAKVFAITGDVQNCVNIQSKSPAKYLMLVRHYNKVGVLAGVLDRISRAQINVEEMANTMYQGHEAAVAAIRLDDQPNDDVVADIASMTDQVIKVEVKRQDNPNP